MDAKSPTLFIFPLKKWGLQEFHYLSKNFYKKLTASTQRSYKLVLVKTRMQGVGSFLKGEVLGCPFRITTNQ